MTCSHEPFQADHRDCKNRLFSPHQDKSSLTRSAWILYGKTFKDTLKLYTLGVQTKTIYACVGKVYMS